MSEEMRRDEHTSWEKRLPVRGAYKVSQGMLEEFGSEGRGTLCGAGLCWNWGGISYGRPTPHH